jgi:hypothetical protein
MVNMKKTTKQMLIDKVLADKEHWGVHESHCCPKHGCKYGDLECPVVLGLTDKHNDHCETCEDKYEDPEPIDLLLAWANTHTDYMNTEDRWGYACHSEVVGVSDLEQLRDEIARDKYSVIKRGIKDGWWVKE